MGVSPVVISLLIYMMQGVSCGTWNLKLPQRVVGISGSCVTVPCQFDFPDKLIQSLVNCSASDWKKGHMLGPSVLSGSSPDTNSIKGSIVGDLTKKNCTTILYSFHVNNSDLYFFRLECSENIKFTFSNGVHISVQPDPSPPSLSSINVLSAGSQVRLQCSVLVPCPFLPPSITWLPRDDSKQEHTQIQKQSQDGQMILTSTLTFIASADHDKQSLTCSGSFPLTNGGSVQAPRTRKSLNVQHAPKDTVATVSPSGPVPVGNAVTFTCSSKANPPVTTYTWYSTDNDGNLNKKAEGETLVLNVCQRDSGLYRCEAKNQKGSEKSEPVSLEVTDIISVCANSVGVAPYIICGVVLVLYVLTVIVGVYMYQSLAKRLKNTVQEGGHNYMNLRASNVSPDYEQVQRQPKTSSSPDGPNYVQPI